MLFRPALLLAAGLWLQVISAAPSDLERLIEDADAVAAVKILSVDPRAMAADGPMYVEAKVLKTVKGKLRAGEVLRFGASAWLGPTFEAGQNRIVFLDPVPGQHAYYQRARWESLGTGKIDLFISREAIEECSSETLSEFLRNLKATPFPLKSEFTRKQGR